MEREPLEHDYLSLKLTNESVKEITMMFIERFIFCLDYVASELVKMS